MESRESAQHTLVCLEYGLPGEGHGDVGNKRRRVRPMVGVYVRHATSVCG